MVYGETQQAASLEVQNGRIKTATNNSSNNNNNNNNNNNIIIMNVKYYLSISIDNKIS